MITDKKSTSSVRSDNEFISFSGILNGQAVRVVTTLADLTIVSRDNITSYDPEMHGVKLQNIEFEDIY